MRSLLLLLAAVVVTSGSSLAAQAVTMPPGDYIIQARDSTKSDSVGMVGWPLTLKSNGTFTIITMPDSLPLAGKILQKDGVATLTEQLCTDGPGVYTLRKERNGYAFDVQSEACKGRDAAWVQLLFVPGKPKK